MSEGNDTIEAIVKRQRQFFNKGVTKTYGFRMAALKRLESALDAFEEELLQALYADLHKSSEEGYLTEIGMLRSELRYVKKHLHTWMRRKPCLPAIGQMPAKTGTVPEPYGVVLIMAPWNYPVLLCLDPLVDALAAGNCVVLKPSAYAPAVSAVISRMLVSVFPQKYVAVVEGGREENTMLLEQRFDYIFFTGGVSVGKLVLEKAARYVTPVTLELGGKSPCIIDKTADIVLAAKRVAFGKLLNAGQTCVAPDYLIVHEDVKEKFITALQWQLQQMEQGNALENEAYPRIVNEKHFHRLCKLMEGESIVYGGRVCKETLQIEPTILDNITLESRIMQEEIFGPIFPVLTFRTPEELKRTVMHFEKPLAFYLFTRSRGMKAWALRTFSFGGGCINDTIMHLASTHMPFGGVGYSGMGGYHGKAGFETFSHRKSVVESATCIDMPFRYQPYEAWKDKIIRRIL